MQEYPTLKQTEFYFFRNLIKDTAGISLDSSKKRLVESRVLGLLKRKKIPNFDAYIEFLKTHPNEIDDFVNAMTTNLTSFFSENSHFDHLTQHLTKNLRGRTINVWSAACSNGHEAYSLMMILEDLFEVHTDLSYRLLATDINTDVLNKASRDVYSEDEIKDIPRDKLKKFFDMNQNKKEFRIKPFYQSKVKFRQFNLLHPQYSIPLEFDIIFLRNVLIYFNEEDRIQVTNSLVDKLKPSGLMYLGHSESVAELRSRGQIVGNSVFQKIK